MQSQYFFMILKKRLFNILYVFIPVLILFSCQEIEEEGGMKIEYPESMEDPFREKNLGDYDKVSLLQKGLEENRGQGQVRGRIRTAGVARVVITSVCARVSIPQVRVKTLSRTGSKWSTH